jgi:hypothetical protein
MRALFCFTLLILVVNPVFGLAQTLNPGVDIAAFFYQVNIGNDGMDAYLADYFVRELGLKLKDRPFNVQLYDGSRDNFEFWVRSQDSPLIITVDITEQGWLTDRAFSIPFIFNIYQTNYAVEAYVRFSDRSNRDLLLNKKFYIKVNGKKAYQILNNDPNDGELTISYSQQRLVEKQCHKMLARRLSDDVYKILKKRRDR